MSLNLIVIMCVLAVIGISLIIWKTKHRSPYRIKDLVKVEEANEQGQLTHVFHHINGIRNGLEQFYFSNGKLNKQKHWVADRLEGETITYFENGETYIIANYNNGLLNGNYIVKNINGKIMQRYTYDNGKRIGE
ncbi:MAG: hypothetical protein GX294_00900 [Candidatus Cloacimonetes bacterium]|nr:hypothetical protein [Candidatus Cloacimonadota bacterium]